MKYVALFALALSSALAHAGDIEVKDAWVRGTVPGQQASGAFLTITSASGGTIIGARSTVAKSTEIHEMKMADGMMKMRAVPRLVLPAGKAVSLNGDYHIMLIGLSKPLNKGDSVTIELQVEGANKKVETVKVNADVRDLTTSNNDNGHSGHHH